MCNTPAGSAFIGWIDLTTLSGSTNNFEMYSSIGSSVSMSSLENIVAYYDTYGRPCIAGFGTTPSGYYGVGFVVPTGQETIGILPYTPHDATVTDNYVVYMGTTTGTNIVIHPVPKTATFTSLYLPFYLYQVGTPTIIEPLTGLHITSTGGDGIATISYALEGSVYELILREFNVSGATMSYNVPMMSSTPVKLNNSATSIFDFQFNSISKVYAVFHNYEVNPSVYQDAVTKIDYSSGVPSSVQSDYLAITNHTMTGISLSDSLMYVVYGYNTTSKENLFGKDYLSASATGLCLYSDLLNVVSALPLVEAVRQEAYYGSLLNMVSPLITINCSGSGENITPICH